MGKSDTNSKTAGFEESEQLPDQLFGFLQSYLIKDIETRFNLPAGSGDIEDFYRMFLFRFSKETDYADVCKERNENVRKYVKDHPDSPLKYLVIINYYHNKEWTRSGFIGGGGVGYIKFDRNISKVIDGRPDVHLFIDMTIKSLSYRFEMGVFSSEFSDTLTVKGIKTPKGWKTNLYNLNLSLGYKFFPNSRLLITPYTGFNIDGISGVSNSDSTLNGISTPVALGAHLGTSLDVRIHDKPIKSMNSLGFRLDVGGAYSGYNRIRSDLGLFYVYVKAGVALMMWGADSHYRVE